MSQMHSAATLQDTARHGNVRILERIDEDPSTHGRTLFSNESFDRSLAERSSKYHERTQSNIQARLSPISSPLSDERTLQSIERLRAFRSSAFNKHSVQPYIKSDCKFIMTQTGETLDRNLKREYGINAPTSPTRKGSQTHRILQEHAYGTERG